MMRVGKASLVQDNLEHVRSMQNSIKEGKYDDFWRYNEEIGEQNLSQLKFFPVRIVVNKHYHPKMLKEDKKKSKGNCFVIQMPVKVNNKDMCIGEYLSRVMPKYFEVQSELIVEEDDEQISEEEKKEKAIESVHKVHKETEVVVNGLKIELDISLAWLVINLSALDNFLYVTVRIPNENND